MTFRLAGIANDSIVDGPGLRLAVFFQGCPHQCPGCHNPESHDPLGGQQADTADICALMDRNPLLDGITLSGGEPFEQPEAALILARHAKEKNLSVWAYTGGLYEDLIASKDEATRELMGLIDVLVDGPFVLAERSLDLRFRGSGNQRLIDVPASRNAGTLRMWQPQT